MGTSGFNLRLLTAFFRRMNASGFRNARSANRAAADLNINTPSYWDEVWEKEGLDAREHVELHSAFCELIPRESKVLDVGCGNGMLIRRLISQNACVCTGLDFSDAILSQLRKSGIETVLSSLPSIPLKDGSFDAAISSETLEHLDEPGQTVHEMHRVTKAGGLIGFSVPDGTVWGSGGEHVQRFTAADCHELLRPYVVEFRLRTVLDRGYPYLLCWGVKSLTVPQYHDKWFGETNKAIADKIREAANLSGLHAK